MDQILLWTFVALAVLLLFRKALLRNIYEAKADFKGWSFRMWKEWGEPFLVAALIAIVIRSFVLGPYKIPTGSMIPTLKVGDRIFVDKMTYRFRPPERGEVIVFKYPGDEKKDYVKRLIAKGGDTVRIYDGQVYVNGEKFSEMANVKERYYYNRPDWKYGKPGQIIEVPEGHYFVLGDNSAHSSDSRNWGFVSEDELVGRALVIWWPLQRIGIVE